ncbi:MULTISPECIES: hypothetical protein [unclassified Oleiphilus]|uniref:hypothetical protein n=1 Tax=unclassified Oleiphilus TaxID=2631174 RepID=UPI0012E8D6A3|nr:MULTISPECIES: hypothetical protein [unclassified Oleiphilus]
MLNNVVLTFFVLLLGSQHAFSAFQHKLEGSSGMASKESEQQHKDQDTDRYFGRYSYYIDPVEANTELLAESAFFSRAAFLSIEARHIEQVPKDDFLRAQVKYDWGNTASDYRFRAGLAFAEHRAEQAKRHLNGGLLGLSVYLLDTAKVDFDTSHVSGDGFVIKESEVNFRQVFTAYENAIAFELGVGYDEYESPFMRVGRRAHGYSENAWGGKLGWYFLPSLQFGIGHSSESRDYRYTNDSSSNNTLLLYGEWTPNLDLSLFFEGSMSREIIEISNADLEVTDDLAKFDAGFKIRF